MRFDERKMKILSAIVETYIRTGEPVGSKALSEMPGIGVSPATVRNEMASLFSMGLLEQPHTSAGRIPSHLGYRIYIDRLMKEEPLPFLLDETFANYDEERLRQTLRWLAEQENQIFLFTCRENEMKLLKEEGISFVSIQL